MSTVKISQLPLITALNANTANSLFMGVDIPTGVTGKFTAHTLAANLYSNEILNVGVNQQNLPNTIAQFSLGGESYIQTNLVNTNDGGTADIVVTANVGSGGTDAANFIDMGYANKNYQPGSEFNNIGNAVRPNDGYLYVQGTSGQNYGNLTIGTTSVGANINFIAGGGSAQNIVAKMTSTGLVLNTQSSITFSDGSSINTAPPTLTYTQGVNTYQNTYAQAAFAKANTAVQNTAVIQLQSLTLTGNNDVTGTITGNNFVANTITVSGVVNPQKGFIYTPNIYPNSQTAITIDFANNSVVRAQTAAGLVVTLSNFVIGKVVDAWITNTAGTNQTFTHGVSALNSTINATTYNIPGTSTIYVKYWSIDGTLTNTFCSIVHA
jgi:hypothetical protein